MVGNVNIAFKEPPPMLYYIIGGYPYLGCKISVQMWISLVASNYVQKPMISNRNSCASYSQGNRLCFCWYGENLFFIKKKLWCLSIIYFREVIAGKTK